VIAAKPPDPRIGATKKNVWREGPMVRCWCHAAMAGWLDALSTGVQAAPAAVRRWQHECERAGADCASRVEAIALRLHGSRALRCGNTLRIYTHPGPVEFEDAPRPGAPVHRYLGLLETRHAHLVFRLAADGIRFLTVCQRSGQVAAFEGLSSAVSGTVASSPLAPSTALS
jgi:hypothetical protein